MNGFLQNTSSELLETANFTEDLKNRNRRIYKILKNLNTKANDEDFLVLLMPLIEVAWADGEISPPETAAILSVAQSYGLTDRDEIYAKLLKQISVRPTSEILENAWKRIHLFLRRLAPQNIESIGRTILLQSKFVANQSPINLRDEGVCADELSIIQKISEELKKIKLAGERNLGKSRNAKHSKSYPLFSAPYFEKLLPLVPLVKVAWAEGRITNRERQIVFSAAERNGITPENNLYRKLADWLELHPTDDFYNESLEYLRLSWQNLDAEERNLRFLDILSDCALIAEASGGNSKFQAGGPRICDEEFAAVKRVAEKLCEKRQITVS